MLRAIEESRQTHKPHETGTTSATATTRRTKVSRRVIASAQLKLGAWTSVCPVPRISEQ